MAKLIFKSDPVIIGQLEKIMNKFLDKYFEPYISKIPRNGKNSAKIS